MRCLDRIAALAGISLAACGGGTPIPPDLTPAAIAEATKTLEAAKAAVTKAYASNRAFPATPQAPISQVPPAGSKYVSGVSYNGLPWSASVVVSMTGTGNPIVDGNFLGVFGAGQSDGTVTWQCGTASAMTTLSPSAQTMLYPYLPDYCQN